MNPYRELFSALNGAEIHYLIVGGLAVNLHGHRRFTADIDILLALDPSNLEKMTSIMHKMGYVERLSVQLKELSDSNLIEKLLKEKEMIAYTFLSNNHERIDIDILTSKSLRFSDYEKKKVFIDIDEGIKVPVISINDLIEMKKEANRSKDILDIEMLLELKQL